MHASQQTRVTGHEEEEIAGEVELVLSRGEWRWARIEAQARGWPLGMFLASLLREQIELERFHKEARP